METIVEGIVSVPLKPVQPEKASQSIVVTPSGMTILPDQPVECAKVCAPIFFQLV
jgi:hypothetical protein